MSVSARKRSIIYDSYSAKRFKSLDEFEEELSDNDLQIDLNPSISISINDDNQEDFCNSVSWKRSTKYDYFNTTIFTGHRCYVKFNENPDIINNSRPPVSVSTASEGYYKLLENAEQILTKKRARTNIMPEKVPEISKVLFATKYSPKNYIDLLTPEFVNRNLLSWFKSWDKYIFKRNTKFIEKLKNSASNMNSNFDDWLKINPKNDMPVKKVILLAGPPGLGKTTLVQILAKHCGYFPFQINASDDRNPEHFRKIIADINDTRSFEYRNANQEQLLKPSCLILDEIDGAPGPAVNVLVNAINASNKTDQTESSTLSENKKKEKSQLKIMRPVICICNDLYSPSLKQLRSLCHVIKITSPDFNQLFNRLNEICKLEGIDCDRKVLTDIIDVSNRDIRACLNTLSFLWQPGTGQLNSSHLSNINIGQKDVELNAFKIWQHIFTEPNITKSQTGNQDKSGCKLTLRSKHILQIAHSAGDIDRIITGIHENYLAVARFKDLFLNEMVEASEWLVFNDMANKKISSNQLFEMIKYKEFLVPYFHLSFTSSAISPSSIHWPTSDSNAQANSHKITAIYDSFASSQGTISQWIQCKQSVIQSILPHLVHIIKPIKLRPLNTQLYSSKEKIMLQNTVEIMIATGLGYTQEKLAELQYQYVLNPNIEEIVRFNLSDVVRKELTYSAKQLIANEISREKIKKSKHKSNDSTIVKGSQNRIAFITQKENEMKSKMTKNTTNISKEIFNFRLGPKSYNKKKDESNTILAILEQPVWFQFKEGFTNAIKRPVRLRDL